MTSGPAKTPPPCAAAESSRRSRLLREGPFLLLPLLVPILLFGAGILPGKTIVQTDELDHYSPWLTLGTRHQTRAVGHPDIPDQVYPLEAFAIHSVARGESPFLWNPAIFCGTRNVMNSPLRSIFFWVPTSVFPLPTAHGVMILVMFQIMGVFAYVWIRTLGASPAGASLGALAYATNTSFVVWTYPEILESCLWFPLLLTFVERWWRGGRPAWLGAAGLVAGIQLFSGHPQYTIFCWGFLMVYVGWRALRMRGRPDRGEGRRRDPLAVGPGTWRRGLAPWLVPAFGLLAGAAHLVPFFLYQSESRRGLHTMPTPEELRHFATPIDALASFFNPRLPGNWTHWWYETAGYAGLFCTGLAIYAAIRRDGARRTPRGFLMLAGLVAVASCEGPVSRLLRLVPGLHTSPLGRASFLITLCLAALGAFGLDRLREENPRAVPWRKHLAFLGLGAIAVVLAQHGLARHFQAKPDAYFRIEKELASQTFDWSHPLMWHPLLAAAGIVGVLLLWRSGRLPAKVLIGLLVLGQAADVTASVWPYTRANDASRLFVPLPWLSMLRRATETESSRVAVVSIGPYIGNHLLPFDIATPTGYSSAYAKRYGTFFERRFKAAWASTNAVFVHPDVPRDHILRDLGFLNVRYLLSARPLDEWMPALRRIPRVVRGQPPPPMLSPREAGGALLRRLPANWPWRLQAFVNPFWVPRVLRVESSLGVESGEDAYEAILAPGFDPRRTVVLEASEEALPPFPGSPPREFPPDPRARVRIVSHHNDEVTIETGGTRPAYVVLQETFDPGWTVTVDGHPAEALRANYLFRAVRVPPGAHRITWRFHLPGLPLGLMVSAAGIALCGVLLLWRRSPWPPTGRGGLA